MVVGARHVGDGIMRSSSMVLFSPNQAPGGFGETVHQRPIRMGSALIWKGGGNEVLRPLTCSYSFASSSRRPPTDRLKTQSGNVGGVRLVSKGPSSSARRRNQQANAPDPRDDDLETILCVEDERVRCNLSTSSSKACMIDRFCLNDVDSGDDDDHEHADCARENSPSFVASFSLGSESPPQAKRPSIDLRQTCMSPASSTKPEQARRSTPMQPSTSDSLGIGQATPSHLEAASFSMALPDKELDLRSALAAHDIDAGCIEPLKALGVRRVSDLSLLTPEDLNDASLGINVLQRRLIKAAIEKEKAGCEKRRADAERAARTWSRMTDDRGWYPLPFSREPPGLRLTMLEPAELAGTVIDMAFGTSRQTLCEAASRIEHDADGLDRFELKLMLGRTDKTEFDSAKGNLNFGVVGVSRNHAEIVISCGDSMPATIRVRDTGSTNGTYLLRTAGSGSLFANHSFCDDESADACSARRPDTPSGNLMQLKLDEHCWNDCSGCPYLRLGPRLVLGLSFLKNGPESRFSFSEAAMTTERLYSEPDLRRLGWQDANLEHIAAAKRRKERVNSMLNAFAAGGISVAKALAGTSQASQAARSIGTASRRLSLSTPLDQPEGGHVFLSYQWDTQHLVRVVAEELKSRGYKVWIDLEQMQGKMNERMAEAVEGACVVCPFISRQYKRSPNCMKELNYADQLGKTFLPIIVDDCDRSELLKGQVGIITSNLIYIDLSRLEATLPKEAAPKMSPEAASLLSLKMGDLERALGQRGKTTATLTAAAISAQPPAKAKFPPTPKGTLISTVQSSTRSSLDGSRAASQADTTFSPDGKHFSSLTPSGISGARSSLGALPAIV